MIGGDREQVDYSLQGVTKRFMNFKDDVTGYYTEISTPDSMMPVSVRGEYYDGEDEGPL